MANEKPTGSRSPEELNSLFMKIQDRFKEFFQVVTERRNIEGFAGLDISPDNKKLNEILDKLNAEMASLGKPGEAQVNEQHIMAFIDATLDLLTFIGNKGAIKPAVKQKLDDIVLRENIDFAKQQEPQDQTMFLLSVAGSAMEAGLLNLINTAIHAFNAYTSRNLYRMDALAINDPGMDTFEHDPKFSSFAKKEGKTPRQMYALLNRFRSGVLAAGIAIMTVGSTVSMIRNHTSEHADSAITATKNPENGIMKNAETILRLALSTIRLILLYMTFTRFITAHKAVNKIDYALLQRFKLDEIDEKTPDSGKIKALKKLFSELQEALDDMHRDAGYDPTPLIGKIKEALETVAANKDIDIKEVLRTGKRETKEEIKRKKTNEAQKADVTENAGDSPGISAIIGSIRVRALQTIQRFALPPLVKKLTREEKKDLYERNKASALQKKQLQAAVPATDAEQTERPTPTPTSTPKPEAPATQAPVEVLTEREQLIKSISFQRTLDKSQFRKFLRSMTFKKMNGGGKGSHEKYTLETTAGSLMVIVSLRFDHFDDVIIKNDILKKPPHLNPEWVYWSYCKHFGFPESIKAYEEFFGKEFDAGSEPTQI